MKGKERQYVRRSQKDGSADRWGWYSDKNPQIQE